MSDTALAVIIIAVLVLAWPVWVPVAYMIALTLFGLFVGAVVGIVALIVWTFSEISKLFKGSRA